MTLIIGVRCTDGVVIAADSAVTMGSVVGGTTAELTVGRKLSILHDSMIVGFSGFTGLAYRLTETLREQHPSFKTKPAHKALEKIREHLLPTVESELKMARVVAETTRSQEALQTAIFSILIGIPLNGAPQLISLDQNCSPDLVGQDVVFATVGSGQRVADPFMGFVREVLWPARGCPGLREGTLGALWAMRHAIRTNTGGVGGTTQVMILRKDGNDFRASELDSAVASEHDEAINDLEKHIKGWREQMGQPASSVPPSATPPA